MIVGIINEGSLNLFFCIVESYGDFEFEFEVCVDNWFNFGV